MSAFDEIAAILHPMPEPGDVVPEDLYTDACDQVDADRRKTIDGLEAAWDADTNNDPVLSAIESARSRRHQAEAEIRRLVAYGREFTVPRPYTLADLAGASGMSVSGIRTAYGQADVTAVATATGRTPRDWRSGGPGSDRG